MTSAEGHVIVLDQPQDWLGANERVHWSRRHRLTSYWRQLAHVMARKAGVPMMDRAAITVTFHKPTRHRYDPANLYPTAKAIVDGIVDAGVLVDDDAVHLVGPDMRAGEAGPRRIVVRVVALPITVAGQA